jgi:hypothetical protein
VPVSAIVTSSNGSAIAGQDYKTVSTSESPEITSARATDIQASGELHDAAAEIIERERRNLQRACALLDCLCIASTYDYEEEVQPGDVAYVVSGLVMGAANALDCVELRKVTRQHPPEPP